MDTLQSWHAMGRTAFLLRFALAGASAGFAAWGLVYGVQLLMGVERVTGTQLWWAVVRGVLVALVLAVVLSAYLRRKERAPGGGRGPGRGGPP